MRTAKLERQRLKPLKYSTLLSWLKPRPTTKPVEQASACFHLNFAALAKFKPKQAEQSAEKVGRFVGRGFSHDVGVLDSSGF